MLNCLLFQGRKALLPELQRPGGDGKGQDVREATDQSMKYNIFNTLDWSFTICKCWRYCPFNLPLYPDTLLFEMHSINFSYRDICLMIACTLFALHLLFPSVYSKLKVMSSEKQEWSGSPLYGYVVMGNGHSFDICLGRHLVWSIKHFAAKKAKNNNIYS